MNNNTSLFPREAHRQFDADPTGLRSRGTLAARVAGFFEARPGEWIDGREVQTIAGVYGWRTRISDCRRPPYNLNIINRQRRLGHYTVSEYMLVANGVTPRNAGANAA